MDRSRTRECTDDPETTGEAFEPGEMEIFFGLRTGWFSALDDSTSKTVSLEQGTAGSHHRVHRRVFWNRKLYRKCYENYKFHYQIL